MNYLEEFNQAIDYWITELDQYDIPKLTRQPGPGQWSVGQLYLHLIDDTEFYLQQIQLCLSGNQHADQQASPTAKKMFLENAFPDMKIAGAPDHATIPQPSGKEELGKSLMQIRTELNSVANKFSDEGYSGKSKHPGLGYFSAQQWLQFAGMHFRHHVRQKNRIDEFLSGGQ